MPGVGDLAGLAVDGFGLHEGGGDKGHFGNLLPLVVADDGDAGDAIAVLLEETHFIPAGGPGGAVHFRNVGEQADGMLVGGDGCFDVGSEFGEVFGGELAVDLVADGNAVGFFEFLDHELLRACGLDA